MITTLREAHIGLQGYKVHKTSQHLCNLVMASSARAASAEHWNVMLMLMCQRSSSRIQPCTPPSVGSPQRASCLRALLAQVMLYETLLMWDLI